MGDSLETKSSRPVFAGFYLFIYFFELVWMFVLFHL
uniref:Uncharacterized protein n=1 Tax=Rhizophora mucronata TaxID=61149 RepID=A0A2P2PJK4_RHIMU